MKLFVANCTKQNVDFMYRVPEAKSVRMQGIKIGMQIEIAGDLSSPQVDSIIAQHRKYGLVSADEVKSTKQFVGLCYSIDKPVKLDNILLALDRNRNVLIQRGQQIRQEAAVATNMLLEERVEENQLGRLRQMEVTVVEDERRNATGDEGEPVSEALRVTRETNPDGSPIGDTASTGRQARNNRGRRAA